LFVSLVILPIVGCAPAAKVEVPTEFTEYNLKDGTAAINYPTGWEAEGTGSRSRGRAYATFRQGDYEIRLDASFADSLASGGGAAQAMIGKMGGVDAPELLPPEEMIQKKNLSWFEEQFKAYEEDEGELIRIPLGNAFVNNFSGQRNWLKIKGMRAAIMARDRSVSFHAFCPASKWETFGPIFRKMFEELKPGVVQ
jgi:hypothetical protein